MKRLFNLAPLLLALTTLFWAGNAIVGKMAVGHVSPMQLSFWRWVLAFIILLPFAWRVVRRDWPHYRTRLPMLLLLALLSVSIYNSFQYLALQWTQAINIGVVSACMPLMVFVLSWLIRKERPGAWQKLGLALAFCGVLVMISEGRLEVLVKLAFNPGDLLMLLAVLSFALYSVLIHGFLPAVDRLGLLLVLIGLGTLGILPFYLWDLYINGPFSLTPLSGGILLYVALFPSLAAYFFWNRAVELGGANLAAVYVNLISVYASVMAVLFLDEQFALYHLVGMLSIFTGILLATARTRARA